MKTTTSIWSPESRTLRTTLEGVVSEEDVEAWEASLRTAVAAVPAGATFKLLYDQHGYEPETIDAHNEA